MHQIQKFTDYLVLGKRDWDKKITKGMFGTIDLVHIDKYCKVLQITNKLNLLKKNFTQIWNEIIILLYLRVAPCSQIHNIRLCVWGENTVGRLN